MNYRKHLNDLKSKLVRKQMSLLVGSGFSKNVSLRFPSWEELLLDLVCEMNKGLFDAEYIQKVQNSHRRIDRAEFMKQKCREAIAKRGYLDIVSDYLKQSSPEAITTYIEERTPYIEYEKDQLFLQTGTIREKLKSESLNLHRMILELPWNNVYTTNYDQLLDVCVTESQYQVLADEIECLEKEIYSINIELDDSLQQLNKLELQGKSTSYQPGDLLSDTGFSVAADQEELHKKKEGLRKAHRELYDSIQAKTEQIESKEQAQVNCFNIVRGATDLQLKRNNNIIKLHGSLRTKDEREAFNFGFDGDHKKQYIISREHYDTYPKEHEPFTQLMRISLLQESFCLIGFSGDDPNFLAWVDWVRDIIQRDGSKNHKGKNYKIYLIDVSEGDVTKAKQLFFENYNILRVPLMDPEVIDIIRGSQPIPSGQDRLRTCIQMFLTFLGDHEKMNLIVPVSDLSVINEWQAVWNKLNFYTLDLWQSKDLIKSSLHQLETLRDKILIPNLKDRYSQNQEKLLRLLIPGNKSYLKKEFDSDNLKLLLHAIKDSFLPINYAIDQAYIDKLLAEPLTSIETASMLNVAECMNNRHPSDKVSDFQKTLSLAFAFKFDELIIHLRAWNSTPGELMKKAGFLSFLSPSECEKLLETELRNYEQFSPEQRLYIYELLAFVKMTRYWSRDRKLDKLIAGFKNSGFTSIEDNLRELYRAMDEEPEKPEPLGADRYTVSRPQQFDEHPHTRYALKFLMLLVESGFHLNIRRVNRLSIEEWYKIINKGFEFYPAAFLFYGLQLENPDYLKRLGQDYALSLKINDTTLNEIAINLLDASATAHHEYKKNIYVFLSTMLISVDPLIWEDRFIKLWKNGVADSTAFEEKHQSAISPLASFAFRYIKSTEHLLEILKGCLEAVLAGTKAIVVDYLYYLNRNVHYNHIKRSVSDQFVIDDVTDQIIESLNLHNVNNIKVLGNIHSLLNDNQKQKIVEKISALDFQKIGDAQLWRIIVYFLKDEVKILGEVKGKLFNSRALWYSGIDGNTIAMGPLPLELSRITSDATSFGGLSWTDQEVGLLYEKLRAGLPDLQRHASGDDPWSSFDELINEMFWFVNFYKDKLCNLETFQQTHAIVQRLYSTIVTYNSIEEGLISNKKSEVNYALSELSSLFYKGDVRKELINIVVNRVMLQSQPAVESALSYLSAWLSHKNGKAAFDGITRILVIILKKYRNQFPSDAERSFTTEHLVKIAYGLKALSVNDDIIAHWIAYANESRFNNIKQLLAKIEYDYVDLE